MRTTKSRIEARAAAKARIQVTVLDGRESGFRSSGPAMIFRWTSKTEIPWQAQMAEVLRVAAAIYEEAALRGEKAYPSLPHGIGMLGRYEDGWRTGATISFEVESRAEEARLLVLLRDVASAWTK